MEAKARKDSNKNEPWNVCLKKCCVKARLNARILHTVICKERISEIAFSLWAAWRAWQYVAQPRNLGLISRSSHSFKHAFSVSFCLCNSYSSSARSSAYEYVGTNWLLARRAFILRSWLAIPSRSSCRVSILCKSYPFIKHTSRFVRVWHFTKNL